MSFKRLVEVGTFEAGRNRIGEVSLVSTECSICSKTTVCLYIDSSEGEYGGGAICQNCTSMAFQKAEAHSLQKPSSVADAVAVDDRGYFHREHEKTNQQGCGFLGTVKPACSLQESLSRNITEMLDKFYKPLIDIGLLNLQEPSVPASVVEKSCTCTRCGDISAYCLC